MKTQETGWPSNPWDCSRNTRYLLQTTDWILPQGVEDIFWRQTLCHSGPVCSHPSLLLTPPPM